MAADLFFSLHVQGSIFLNSGHCSSLVPEGAAGLSWWHHKTPPIQIFKIFSLISNRQPARTCCSTFIFSFVVSFPFLSFMFFQKDCPSKFVPIHANQSVINQTSNFPPSQEEVFLSSMPTAPDKKASTVSHTVKILTNIACEPRINLPLYICIYATSTVIKSKRHNIKTYWNNTILGLGWNTQFGITLYQHSARHVCLLVCVKLWMGIEWLYTEFSLNFQLPTFWLPDLPIFVV